jgi:hypothetical protein
MDIYRVCKAFCISRSLQSSSNMAPRKFCDDASLVEVYDVKPVAAGVKEEVVAELVSIRKQASGLIDAWLKYLDDIDSQIPLSRTWVDQEIKIGHSRIEDFRAIIGELDALAIQVLTEMVRADEVQIPDEVTDAFRDWTAELQGRYPQYGYPDPVATRNCTLM